MWCSSKHINNSAKWRLLPKRSNQVFILWTISLMSLLHLKIRLNRVNNIKSSSQGFQKINLMSHRPHQQPDVVKQTMCCLLFSTSQNRHLYQLFLVFPRMLDNFRTFFASNFSFTFGNFPQFSPSTRCFPRHGTWLKSFLQAFLPLSCSAFAWVFFVYLEASCSLLCLWSENKSGQSSIYRQL